MDCINCGPNPDCLTHENCPTDVSEVTCATKVIRIWSYEVGNYLYVKKQENRIRFPGGQITSLTAQATPK